MPNQGITQSTLPQAPIKPFTSAPSTSTLTPQSVVSPIQPQAPQPASQTAPQNGALDPKIVNLAQAIRQTESQGNFAAKGASGEYGAYQFMPDTWNGNAPRFGVNVPLDQATPAQQNEVAYKQLQEWSTQHPDWNVGNFASAWNAGPGKPDAYLQNNVGTNSKGVSYDTPAYAQKVAEAYQQFKAQNAQNAPVANVPQQGDTSSFLGDLSSGNVLGAAEKAGDFAFPIVSDLAKDFQGSSTKSTLQQLGDAGMSALWFLPYGGIAGRVAEGAAEALGAGKGALGAAELISEALPSAENTAKAASLAKTAKTAKLIGNVATGLGAGYTGDVSANLSQGKTGTDALQPGLGTLAGGALPVALTGGGAFYNKFVGESSIIDKVQQAYEDAAGSTKSGIKNMSKTASKGLDPNPEFLAHAGILPETEEINGRRVFTTGEESASQKTIQGRITDLTNLRDEAIAKAGADVPVYLEDMRQKALQEAAGEFSGTAQKTVADHINAEFDAYKGQFGDKEGNISLTEANSIKKDLQGKTNYDATRPSIITRANSLMANVAKTSVEQGAEGVGLKGVKDINKIIQQHIDAKAFLNRINGQTVKGGRIGKYIEGAVGAYAGNTLGASLGGGLGGAAGTLVGGAAGLAFSHFMQKFASGGTISAAAIGRMAAQDPEVVQNFLQYLGKSGKILAPVIHPAEESGASIAQDVMNKSPGDRILKAFDHDGALKAGYSQEEIDSFLESETGESKNTP